MEASAVRNRLPCGKENFSLQQLRSRPSLVTRQNQQGAWGATDVMLCLAGHLKPHKMARERNIAGDHEFSIVVREMQKMSYMNLIGDI